MLPMVSRIETIGFFMYEIDAHSMKILEFPKLRELVAGMTLSPYGRRYIEDLCPQFDREIILKLLRQSAQMRDIIRFEEAIPLTRIEDITGIVEKTKVEGIHLEPKSLLQIKQFLDAVISLSAYGKVPERAAKFSEIVEIIFRFHPQAKISAAIGKAIDSSGEILDSASPLLGRIRREVREAEGDIQQHLNKLLGSRRKHTGWQDDVITVRDGRYVIPVLSGDFHADEGIVHDKSHSGATLFVEPTSAVPINNRLRQLQQDERLELDRILRQLTAMIGEVADNLMADIETYGLLDAAHARATFALKINAESPEITDKSSLSLVEARHPLLLYTARLSTDIVPLTVNLDRDNQGILITGPNTGGKTVALKTIGLLTLMAMSGLEIPADHKSQIGIYRKIYADIGDEQSLELSLSTFSSHVRNIIAAIEDADDESLVLLDEIGAGTDPREGAALAETIILNLLERGSNLVVTTHYSQLKTLPLEQPGLLNASLEFDRQNLEPTFRLKLGVPGASYAIEIARRLGLPQTLAERAASLLSSDERSLDRLIEKLDHDLEHLHKEKKELEERLVKAQALEEFYRSRTAQLQDQENELTKQYAERWEKQLQEDKQRIDRLVKEIRETQAESAKIKESHRYFAESSKKISNLKASVTPRDTTDGKVLKEGEIVWIEKLQTEGEVLEMVGDKKAKVAIGSASMIINTIDLVRRREKKPVSAKSKVVRRGTIKAAAAEGEFNPELMLRGLTVEEAVEKLDKFLDDAVVAGVGQVYIVHGKGTGTLRRRLSEYLKTHRAVESIRIGDWNEGGHGVTIARLKG